MRTPRDQATEPPRPSGLGLPPALGAASHKGNAGRCWCLAGSRTMPGAALLVARAAQRAGAGLVRMGCLDACLLTILPGSAPEAVLVDLENQDPEEVREELESSHAWLAGPGLGNDARTRAWIGALLRMRCHAPRVLDADALNALDGEPERVFRADTPTVLTPHPGEARRLLGAEVPDRDSAREACARELAVRSGAVVCLKGRHTVVTDGERLSVNETGNPGMATAGSGDVLAGILVAYLARASAAGTSVDAFRLARTAVHVHGRAGDLAAEKHGERALVASDLIERLGTAQLELERD